METGTERRERAKFREKEERTGVELLTIHHLPLLVQPAARRVVPALQHHMVALQAASEVVPGRGDHGVFALQVFDDLFGCGLGRLS